MVLAAAATLYTVHGGVATAVQQPMRHDDSGTLVARAPTTLVAGATLDAKRIGTPSGAACRALHNNRLGIALNMHTALRQQPHNSLVGHLNAPPVLCHVIFPQDPDEAILLRANA